jgi:hypothetical protein
MKLWETYFRMWDRFRGCLTEGSKSSLLTGESTDEKKIEDKESSYYGFLCDQWGCIETGVERGK